MSWQASASNYPEVRRHLGLALSAIAARRDSRLPPDYAAWIAHLLWLNSCLSAEILTPRRLTADEAEGIRLLHEVTRELSQKLLRCPHCNGFTEAGLSCRACGRLLSSPAAARP